MKIHFLWLALLVLWPAHASAQTQSQSLTWYDTVYTVEVRGDEVWLRMKVITDTCMVYPVPMEWKLVPGGFYARIYGEDYCKITPAGFEVVAHIGKFEGGTHTFFLQGCGFNWNGWVCEEVAQLVFQVPTIKVATVPSGGAAANLGLGGLLLILAWLALRLRRNPVD